MSQYATELCSILVADNFGELYAVIFSYLLRHGRQSLERLIKKTHLSNTQVKPVLAVLIQQHLIFHCTSLDDGVTYYEADWRTAYRLVRSGKILELVEEKLGTFAATVLATILSLGHAQITYLETLPELRPQQQSKRHSVPKKNRLNGVHPTDHHRGDDSYDPKEEPVDRPNVDNHRATGPQLHAVLCSLASHGYIMRVRDAQFQSPEDNYDLAERTVRSRPDIRGLKGKKLQEALNEGVENLIKERTDGTISQGMLADGFPRGIKRRAGKRYQSSLNKRAKIQHVLETDEEDGGEYEPCDDYSDNVIPMDSNLVIRVNYEKFEVAFRNERLIGLAEQNVSPVTSLIYKTLLSRIELQTPRCRRRAEAVPEGEEAEYHSVAVPIHTISEDLDPHLDLSGAIAGMDPPTTGRINATHSAGGRGKRPLENGDGELDGDGYAEADPDRCDSPGRNRLYEIEQHLYLLAQEPYRFSTRILQSGIATWAVEYQRLARKLRHLELERIIESRFGSVAVRIVRILAAKGKLDERRLQEISLMASKDLRQILARMEAAGFIDLQEVPRDAQRQPSRTIYLWFYDPDRVRMMVLDDTYKSMSRCLQRIAVERNKLKWFLEKTERTDVKGNEERYLSAAELKTLQEWRDKEALLLGEVGRLDDLVAVLRDF